MSVARKTKAGKAVLCGAVMCSFGAQYATAAEFAYGGGYVGQSTSNLMLSPTDAQSARINSLRVGFAYQEATPEVLANVRAQGEYRTYQQVDLADQHVRDLDASGIWTISPQRLSWMAQDVNRQVTNQVGLANSDANRTEVNTFNTGPDVQLRFGSASSLLLEGRYGYVSYQDHVGNNARYSGNARWRYLWDESSTLSLNYERLRVLYKDSETFENNLQQNVYGRYETHSAHSQFSLDLGETSVDYERGAHDRGSSGQLTWTRDLDSQSNFGLMVMKEFSDTGSALLATGTSAAGVPATGTDVPGGDRVAGGTGDRYVLRRADLFYGYHGSTWELELRAFGDKYDYRTNDQMDRRERGGFADVTFNHTATFATTMFDHRMRTTYLNYYRVDDDKNRGIRFTYRFARSFTALLEGSRNERGSTDPTQDYEDRRVLIALLYSSAPLYSPTIPR